MDLNELTEYLFKMERTGSSPCYIETKQLREIVNELIAARTVCCCEKYCGSVRPSCSCLELDVNNE